LYRSLCIRQLFRGKDVLFWSGHKWIQFSFIQAMSRMPIVQDLDITLCCARHSQSVMIYTVAACNVKSLNVFTESSCPPDGVFTWLAELLQLRSNQLQKLGLRFRDTDDAESGTDICMESMLKLKDLQELTLSFYGGYVNPDWLKSIPQNVRVLCLSGLTHQSITIDEPSVCWEVLKSLRLQYWNLSDSFWRTICPRLQVCENLQLE
jgi:hypothetical protein